MPNLLAMKSYRTTRRITQALTTLVVIVLPFLKIVRFDIPTVRVYFVNSVLWAEEFYFLFLCLMLFAWLILTLSMLYGRVWCGWMCPQMALIEFTLWLRTKLRRVLKFNPQTSSTITRTMLTAATTLLTALLALFLGFVIVAYFVDPYRMLADISHASLHPVTVMGIVGVGLFFFIDLTFWREKLCSRACPYGMLQMVITDDKTQILRYHTERDPECGQCNACVSACVMGIDIRKSPYQTECIHCGDCVDACARMLSRVKPPALSLISFSWGEGQTVKQSNIFHKLGLFDMKRWALVSLTLIFFGVLLTLSYIRQPLDVSISGDRFTLYRPSDAGEIINDYTAKITNRGIEQDVVNIMCPDTVQCASKDVQSISLEGGETKEIKFSMSSTENNLHPGPNKLQLRLQSANNDKRKIAQEIIFFMPERW